MNATQGRLESFAVLDLIEAVDTQETLQWTSEVFNTICEGATGEDIEEFNTWSEEQVVLAIQNKTIPNNEDPNAFKKRFLKTKLALYAKENREKLEPIFQTMLAKVQKQRALKETHLYPKASILVMVHELIYGSWLWRKKTRDTGESYFDTHLVSAFNRMVEQSFTNMPNLLAALKHDDLEDLDIHKENCAPNIKGSPKTPLAAKEDWLFCDVLYIDEPVGPIGGKDPKEQIVEIKKKTIETVKALTHPVSVEELGQDEKDAYKLLVYLKNLVETKGFAAAVKVSEQGQNAETIEGKKDINRQKPKLRRMLKTHGLLSKILKMEHIAKILVEAGLKYLRPELLEEFTREQNRRIRGRMTHCIAPLLKAKETEIPLAPLITELIEAFDKPENIENVQAEIRKKVADVFESRLPAAQRVRVVPTPVSEYVDIDRLCEDNASDVLTIHPTDPMFELEILVRDEAEINATMRLAAELFSDANSIQLLPYNRERDGISEGARIFITGPRLGGNLHLRINTIANATRAKRGIRAEQGAPLPAYLRKQIARAIYDHNKYGRDIYDAIAYHSLRPTIRTYTPADDIIALQTGATVVDFAAALPGSNGEAALVRGKRAFRIDTLGHKHSVPFFDPVHDGDRIEIEIGSPEEQEELKLSDFAFSRTVRTEEVAREYYNKKSDEKAKAQGKTREKDRIRREDRIARGTQYLLELNHILKINDPNWIVTQCVGLFRERKQLAQEMNDGAAQEEILAQIGNIKCDPLWAIARKIDRSKLPESGDGHLLEISGTVKDRRGLLQEFGRIASTAGINIETYRGAKSEIDSARHEQHTTLHIPRGMSNYDLLKFLVRLNYEENQVVLESSIFTEE